MQIDKMSHNIYGRGIDDMAGGDDLFFVEERNEMKQGGFQPMIDFKNKFSFVPVMTHFKGAPKLMSIGTNVSYGISDTGEILAWTTEDDQRSSDRNFNIDLKSLSSGDNKDGLIGKTANLLNFGGREKGEIKKLVFTNIYSTTKGDFCIFTTLEGENYIFIQKTRTIEPLTKLKRIVNAIKYLDVVNEEDRSIIRFICTSSIGMFSTVGHPLIEGYYRNPL